MELLIPPKPELLKLEYPENLSSLRSCSHDELPIFSFFTGAGFLDFGFESVGFRTQSINESHAAFIDGYLHGADSLMKNSKAIVHHCSIDEFLAGSERLTKFSSSSNPVGFIGGPPCPDFSVAGKQKGKTGDNGRLTGSYAQLICECMPDWFLLENVKGLWRTKKHRDFYDEICQKLISNGYCLTNRLINSIEYGVPQDRERIILIGFKASMVGKRSGGWLLKDEFSWVSSLRYDAAEVLGKPWPKMNPFGSSPSLPSECPKELTVKNWFDKNKVTSHPNGFHYFTPRAALPKFQVIEEGDDSRKSFKRLHRWRYSPTAAYGNNEVHLHPFEARRISAAEAMAIQSLPAHYSLPQTMTLSNMFKTIGNGVPYLCAQGIAKSVKLFLSERAA